MSALAQPVRRLLLPWPLPALLTWLFAWAVWVVSLDAGAPASVAFALAAGLGLAAAMPVAGRWRRLLVATGFPLATLATGSMLPAWAWLLALVPLLSAYPLRAWSDAPFFPTPATALDGLDKVIALAPDARVLDAGCGIGHGLAALRRVWPQARLSGIEWSPALAWLAARRCPWAQVARQDMWAGAWSDLSLVYLFQRPESMARAFAKAQAEMAPGSWLVSLEFAVPGQAPTAHLGAEARRPVWIYRIGKPASIEGRMRR